MEGLNRNIKILGRSFDEKNVRDFKYYPDTLQKDSSRIAVYQFAHYFDILNYSLINETERRAEFHFVLKMKPNIRILSFDGDIISILSKYYFFFQPSFLPILYKLPSIYQSRQY